jgi:hypothetical protein
MYFKYRGFQIIPVKKLEEYRIYTKHGMYHTADNLKEATEQIDKWLDGEKKCTLK